MQLNALSAEDRQRIAELPWRVTNFSANRDVALSGDLSSRCTLILDGFLFSHKFVGGSRRQITSFLVPGDMADLNTLYLPTVDYSLSTLGPAVLAFVSHAALKELLDRSPSLAQAFWRETSIHGAIFREWVVNLGRRDALARVAHVVCEVAFRLQSVALARDLSISIPWTQADLADACGISNVHTNRVIQELRRLELVEWDSKHVKILNWDGLAKVGDFTDDYLGTGLMAAGPPSGPSA
jgi:CRP-like cAMP-binding protein